jgi:phosphatidate cytidylyltransferase
VIKVLARIATAVVGIPIVIWLTFEGGWSFFLLVLVLALVGLWEYGRMTHLSLLLQLWGYAVASALLLTLHIHGLERTGSVIAIAVSSLLCILLFGFDHYGFDQAGTALLGVCYIPMFFGYLLLLRRLPLGARFTVLTFGLTWAVDTAAFFVGSQFGQRHLKPDVSPCKTWAGALAGLITGSVVFLLAAPFVKLRPGPALVIGSVLGMAAMLGDLIESALKRLANVKDAGNILPGHGGILDRFDALLLVAPTAYFILGWWY